MVPSGVLLFDSLNSAATYTYHFSKNKYKTLHETQLTLLFGFLANIVLKLK